LGLTALPLLLLVARVVYTREVTYIHIAWNLFLAWLPLAFAHLALRPGSTPWPFRLAFGLAWLLFLPNAPYLVTDLMHLGPKAVPLLYDVVLLFSAALCGLALGLVSLRWMQAAVAARLGRWPSRVFGIVALGAAGFGVYLGRYLRWNSWDVLLNPSALVRDILQHVAHPVQHWQGWALALLFALLLAFAYWLLATVEEATLEVS
jgi:uncharacterized membrane protein